MLTSNLNTLLIKKSDFKLTGLASTYGKFPPFRPTRPRSLALHRTATSLEHTGHYDIQSPSLDKPSWLLWEEEEEEEEKSNQSDNRKQCAKKKTSNQQEFLTTWPFVTAIAAVLVAIALPNRRDATTIGTLKLVGHTFGFCSWKTNSTGLSQKEK